MTWISTLPHTWEGDPRDPIFTFDLGGQSFDFHFYSFQYLFTVLAFQLFESLMAALISVIVYRYIIQKQGTTSSYMIGYGIIVPFWIFTPSYVITMFGIRNLIFRFICSTITPVLSMFRTTEAMYGFAPTHVTKSQGRYALYYGCPLFSQYDKKTDKYVKGSGALLLKAVLSFNARQVFTGIFQAGMLMIPGFVIFDTQPSYDSWYSFDHFVALFDWRQVLRTLFIAVYLQNILGTYSMALLISQQLITGIQVEPIMENPTLESKSPSEFWGRRWNILIHESLKRGVFKPIRRHFSKYVGVAASFFASGLFHEWLLLHMFPIWQKKHSCFGDAIIDDCYIPPYGFSMGFFLWQAMLISFEYTIGHLAVFKNIPGPLATFLTLCAGGLVGHWFLAPYVDSSFFIDGRPVLVTIEHSHS